MYGSSAILLEINGFRIQKVNQNRTRLQIFGAGRIEVVVLAIVVDQIGSV